MITHGPLQGQMQPLQCSAGVLKPAPGAAAGLARWFVGGAVLLDAGDLQMWGSFSATTARRSLPVIEWPVLGMRSATARLNAASAVSNRSGAFYTGS